MNSTKQNRIETVNLNLTKAETGELIAEIIRQWILHSQENTDFLLWGFSFRRSEIVNKLHDKMFGKELVDVEE